MADDKNKNEDPEEERDDLFDDDEDFGLPDLEYDELDEDEEFGDMGDIEEMEDEPVSEEPESTFEEESVDEIEISEDELDDIELTEEDLAADDESEDWEKELEKELEEELKEEEPEGFYEEESFDEFETGTDEIASSSVFDSDDDASAPSQPAAATSSPKNEAAARYAQTSSYGTYGEEKSNKGKFVRVVVIGTVVIAVIAIILFALNPGDNGAETNKKVAAKKEQPAKKQPVAKEQPKEEEPKPVAKKEEAKPKPKPKPQPQPVAKPAGEITKLDQRTGKAYVIVGSFFDEDLATDYAKELSDSGKSPMIIPPFNNARYYRVAIAEFNSFEDAVANIESYKGEFGSDIWTLRY